MRLADDVIHPTQKNIKYINRPISDNYLAETIKTKYGNSSTGHVPANIKKINWFP